MKKPLYIPARQNLLLLLGLIILTPLGMYMSTFKSPWIILGYLFIASYLGKELFSTMGGVKAITGGYCKKYKRYNAFEIHVGNDADLVIKAKDDNSSLMEKTEQNEKIEEVKVFNRALSEYHDDKSVIYIQLVLKRILEAFEAGGDVYIIADSWNEKYFLDKLTHSKCNPSWFVALTFMLCIKPTKEHPWYDFTYRFKTIPKLHIIEHYHLAKTHENEEKLREWIKKEKTKELIDDAQKELVDKKNQKKSEVA